MVSNAGSLRQKIADHWLSAVVFVVLTTTSATFGIVNALIVVPLRDEIARRDRETVGRPLPAGHGIYHTYEWQWAGENWYERVSLAEEDGKDIVKSARVGELHKKYQDGGNDFSFGIGSRILELVDGSFRRDGERLLLDLTVDKKVIRSDKPERQRIKGALDPCLCFAGKVTYSDLAERRKYPGDMVLVDYISLRDERVDSWFASE